MTREPSHRAPPPSSLVDAAAWTWRALIFVAGAWVLLQVAQRLYLLTLPFAAGILFAALAHPLVVLLRRWGAPRALSVVAAGLTGLVLVGGTATWVVYQAITQGSSLVASAQDALADLPISDDRLDALRDEAASALGDRGGRLAGPAVLAAFHGVVVTITLMVMGVPLAAPLGVLVFLGSLIPIVGAFAFGGFAVVVTFAAQGLVPALGLVGVLVALNQFEAHVLQPFLIGRYVQLNALAVVAALTAGGLLWGVAGAILAVSLTAAVHAGLRARRDTRPARQEEAPDLQSAAPAPPAEAPRR